MSSPVLVSTMGTIAIGEPIPNSNPAYSGNTGFAGGYGFPNSDVPGTGVHILPSPLPSQVDQPAKPNTVVPALEIAATGKSLIMYVVLGLIAWTLYKGISKSR